MTAPSITHKLVSAISTDPAATAAGKVTPTNWNDTHAITLASSTALIGTAGSTAAVEIAYTTIGLAMLQAANAAAVISALSLGTASTENLLASIIDNAGSLDIKAASVTNAMQAVMAADTVKVNNTGSSASPANLALSASTVLGRDDSGHIAALTFGTGFAVTSGAITYTPPAASVTESGISLSDVTTNDVSTSKHGFAPKAPNDATKYLDGTGAYSTPTSSITALGVGSSIFAAYINQSTNLAAGNTCPATDLNVVRLEVNLAGHTLSTSNDVRTSDSITGTWKALQAIDKSNGSTARIGIFVRTA